MEGLAEMIRGFRTRKRWTEEDKEKLLDLAENYSVPEIARKMGHLSENAVKAQLRKLKVSSRNRSGWFTEQEVCEILDVDHRWLKRMSLLGCIKMTPHNPNNPPRKGKSSPWHISESSLKSFIRKYPQELFNRKVDVIMLIDILAGIK